MTDKPITEIQAVQEAIDLRHIHVYGAREHNLRDIDVSIPKNKLVVITGISGSGKSSLAFDTIYAEGQRRYLESFAAYARQFIGGLERPDVDKVTGLSPVISIEQKSTSKNPRSTVGTVTEIYDFLRLFYARVGEAFSYATGKKMVRFSEDQIIENLFTYHEEKKVVFLAPVVRGRKGHYRELFEQLRKQGYLKVRIDGEIVDIRPRMQVDRYKVHDIEIVIDRLAINERNKDRVRNSTQLALKKGDGLMALLDYESNELFQFSRNLMDPESGVSYDEPSPNTFSFNSPYGACPHCNGLGFTYEVNMDSLIPDNSKSIKEGGIAPLGQMRDNALFRQLKKVARRFDFSLYDPVKKLPKEVLEMILYGEHPDEDDELDFVDDDDRWYTLDKGGVVGMLRRCFRGTSSDSIRRWAEEFMDAVTCEHCDGYRLKKESLHFKIADHHIGQLSEMSVGDLGMWFENLEERLNERQNTIARDLLKEIRARIGFLLDVGLDYLSLNRPARSLSGGEAQRIRLATQIGSKLTGITYILDEPSIGLHQRDNQRLIKALKELRDAGNTVIVVEHDKDIMLECDYLIDLGPGAGKHGGKIVGEGTPEEVLKLKSETAACLKGDKEIPIPKKRREGNGEELVLIGATGNNLKEVNAHFPLGKFICVTGVSGSGKSTLINETLYRILNQHFFRARKKPLAYREILGLQHVDKVIEIDQTPIGRTPRSNPATYIKVFDEIRKLFAGLPEAKVRGYNPGRFSFNVKGGRCEDCGGGGKKVIEMNFLPDVLIQCPTCLGRRYNRETLEVRYKGKSISDVLDMTVDEAVVFFENIPKIYRKVKTLQDVGLGYLSLGQSSTTISGGEAQRVKLAAELSKKDTGQTFYILDEPTTGLHFEDINMLLKVLNRLVDRGNTVLVIEHNLDVIKVADHIIDIGLEGGDNGGEIIAEGKPEELAKSGKGYTAPFLKKELHL
jgi:excinuclease ABC subunit A